MKQKILKIFILLLLIISMFFAGKKIYDMSYKNKMILLAKDLINYVLYWEGEKKMKKTYYVYVMKKGYMYYFFFPELRRRVDLEKEDKKFYIRIPYIASMEKKEWEIFVANRKGKGKYKKLKIKAEPTEIFNEKSLKDFIREVKKIKNLNKEICIGPIMCKKYLCDGFVKVYVPEEKLLIQGWPMLSSVYYENRKGIDYTLIEDFREISLLILWKNMSEEDNIVRGILKKGKCIKVKK